MFALRTNSGDGGKTRFSCSTVSMFDAMPAPPGGFVRMLHFAPRFATPGRMKSPQEAGALRPLPSLIFASRWLQLPLYLGLIVAQAVYVWLFWQELYYLLLAAVGNAPALEHV